MILYANDQFSKTLPFGGYRNAEDQAYWTDSRLWAKFGVAPTVYNAPGSEENWNAFRTYAERVRVGGDWVHDSQIKSDSGLGMLGTVALAAAAIYTGGAALGAWGGVEAGAATAAEFGLSSSIPAAVDVAPWAGGLSESAFSSAVGSNFASGALGSGYSFGNLDALTGFVATPSAQVSTLGGFGSGLSANLGYASGVGLTDTASGMSWLDTFKSYTDPLRQANSLQSTASKLTSSTSARPSQVPGKAGYSAGFSSDFTGNNYGVPNTMNIIPPTTAAGVVASDTGASALPSGLLVLGAVVALVLYLGA